METTVITNQKEGLNEYIALKAKVAAGEGLSKFANVEDEVPFVDEEGAIHVSIERFLFDVDKMSYEEAAAIMSSTDDDDYLFMVSAMRLSKGVEDFEDEEDEEEYEEEED